MLRRLRQLMRVTAVRLSAVYLALFAVFAAILVVYVSSSAFSILQSQSRETISEEIGTLGRLYSNGGIPALVRGIDRRSRQPGASLYLVTDGTGRILSGNVQSIEVGILDLTGYVSRPFRYARFTDETQESYHVAVAQVV